MSNDGVRTLTATELLEWSDGRPRMLHFEWSKDALPGGLSAAMAPGLVDWFHSDPFCDDPWIILRNVNHGGNPLEKTTVLRTVRFHLNAVKSVDFVLVPLGKGGRRAAAHHGQLLVRLDEDRPAVVVDDAGPALGRELEIRDFVLSWEAWRRPDEPYSIFEGMVPGRYALTLRAFAGAQRFLEDTLQQRDWYGYPVRIPGGREGLAEVVKLSLALGDGIARHTLLPLMDQGESEWLEHAPRMGERFSGEEKEDWHELRRRLSIAPEELEEIWREAGEPVSYQTLIHSCATLASYAIVAAAARQVQRGHTEGLDPKNMPDPGFDEVEPWMEAIADAQLAQVFLRAPSALRYIATHPQSLPSRIPGELDRMRLLEREGKRPRTWTWSKGGDHPYSSGGIG